MLVNFIGIAALLFALCGCVYIFCIVRETFAFQDRLREDQDRRRE